MAGGGRFSSPVTNRAGLGLDLFWLTHSGKGAASGMGLETARLFNRNGLLLLFPAASGGRSLVESGQPTPCLPFSYVSVPVRFPNHRAPNQTAQSITTHHPTSLVNLAS